MKTPVVHIVGIDIAINNLVLQRCAWCGALLLHYDLERTMVPEGQDPPSVWPVGHFIAVDGGYKTLVDFVNGNEFPDGACIKLDPAVTR